MSRQVERLKGIPILDVAKKLGLEIRGMRMSCVNPTHADRKTPSLHFNVRENYFNCFGCEVGGSTIDLVMVSSGCSRKDAMQWLAQEFGFSRGSRAARRVSLRIRKSRSLAREQKAVRANRPDPEVYGWLLERARLPSKARRYLLKRGLSSRTISDYRLGGCLDAKALVRSAEKRFGGDRLFKAGLLTEGSQLGNLRTVWWSSVILIPFYWKDPEPIYIQARNLSTGDNRKYVGLSGLGKPLFNAQLIGQLRSGAEVYLVEGAMDVMAAHEANLPAIGVLGAQTRFKRNWAEALRPYQVIVVPDQDQAGMLFKDRVVSAFASIGKSVQVRYLPPEYGDLADALTAIKKGKL